MHEVRFVSGKGGKTGDMDHIHRIIYGKLRLENALEVPKTGGLLLQI